MAKSAKTALNTISQNASSEELVNFIIEEGINYPALAGVKILGQDVLINMDKGILEQFITTAKAWSKTPLEDQLIAYSQSVDIIERESGAGFLYRQLDSEGLSIPEGKKWQKITIKLETFCMEGIDAENMVNHVLQVWTDTCDIICKTQQGDIFPSTKMLSKNRNAHWELVKNSDSE
jgi:hypothetical protein